MLPCMLPIQYHIVYYHTDRMNIIYIATHVNSKPQEYLSTCKLLNSPNICILMTPYMIFYLSVKFTHVQFTNLVRFYQAISPS